MFRVCFDLGIPRSLLLGHSGIKEAELQPCTRRLMEDGAVSLWILYSEPVLSCCLDTRVSLQTAAGLAAIINLSLLPDS